LFDGFHREVSVSSINDFEESDLRVTRKVDILSSVSDKLH